ncbi:MAG: HIT family protein [Kiritimatiellae bacterium]|nr:HIT family protein [Kiritimatiellia bacterium]MDD3544168.1 HIT family protein [Kiritimatiellia bacterium]MDD4024962.1 HIT family protein [Kiritimatiellia bacterium]MDD4621907.1 HIT family protein [Kiritimatiellia bacterium]
MTDSNCVFCKIVAGQIPCHKVYEDQHTIAFLDIAPFEKGHVLVVPRCHAVYFTDLPSEQIAPLGMAVRRVAGMLLERLPCDGFNMLQNNGACATQVVPHVHFHVIPRWNGRQINWTSGKYDGAEELQAIQRRLCGER